LVLALLPLPAFAQVPRTAIADLHAEGDLQAEAIGTTIVVTDALTRAANAFVTHADAIEIAKRVDLMDAFEGSKLPPRNGLWLTPAEVRPIADVAHLRRTIVGTMRRDAAQIYVVLHLVEDDNTVHKTVKLTHPLRKLATLPAAVAERAGSLINLDVKDVAPVRRLTLAALGRAWMAAQKKDVESAVAELERAAHDPAADVFTKPLGSLLGASKEGATLRTRALLVVDAKAAVAEAEKFANENPSLMGARLLYARALIAAGRRAEALDVLKPRPGDPEASELHYLRGAAMTDSKRAKDAQTELRKAIELNGDNVEAWYLLGEHAEAAKRYATLRDPRAVSEALKITDAKAADEACKAVDGTQLLPDDAHALARTPAGSFCRVLGAAAGNDLASAATLLEGAHKSAPQDAAVARLLGLVAAEQGRHDVAMEAFAKVAPLDAGREAKAADKTKEAQDFLSRAISTDPAAAARDLGEVLLAGGDAQSAITQLRKATTVMPDDGEGHAILARALAQSGNTGAAANENNLALAIDPELPLTLPSAPGATPAGKTAAKSTTPDKAAPSSGLPGGLTPVHLGIIGGAAALGLIIIVVARRGRRPKRERQTFGAMSATDRNVAEPPPALAPLGSQGLAQKPAVRPPSGESMDTFHDHPSMPGLASLLVEVVDFASVEIPGTQLTMNEKRPIIGAVVWVGNDESKAAKTDEAKAAALLYVPPGEHTLHVRAGGKLLEQVFTVTSPKKIALTVDMHDEVVMPKHAKS
jgi:tetratricopeptide (TPR) repeat protein